MKAERFVLDVIIVLLNGISRFKVHAVNKRRLDKIANPYGTIDANDRSDFALLIGAKSSENERLLTALSDSVDEINGNGISSCDTTFEIRGNLVERSNTLVADITRGRRESGERGKVEEPAVKRDRESVKQKGSVKNIGYINSALPTGGPFK
ncbi:hypothetical protein WN51_09785 [Melipona quadrifasciata]|uniref:Uncharacterized protein n=1 Tax=Melipona quadrifasciata TaxID=166423 RepID=A0A0N0BIB3_9HYME|nr:hypothetical protein WN51_09785 [Melipona quadrifasciata]